MACDTVATALSLSTFQVPSPTFGKKKKKNKCKGSNCLEALRRKTQGSLQNSQWCDLPGAFQSRFCGSGAAIRKGAIGSGRKEDKPCEPPQGERARVCQWIGQARQGGWRSRRGWLWHCHVYRCLFQTRAWVWAPPGGRTAPPNAAKTTDTTTALNSVCLPLLPVRRPIGPSNHTHTPIPPPGPILTWQASRLQPQQTCSSRSGFEKKWRLLWSARSTTSRSPASGLVLEDAGARAQPARNGADRCTGQCHAYDADGAGMPRCRRHTPSRTSVTCSLTDWQLPSTNMSGAAAGQAPGRACRHRAAGTWPSTGPSLC